VSGLLAVGRHPRLSSSTGSAWEPRSACVAECLPEPGALPRIGRLAVYTRLVGLVSVVLAFALSVLLLPMLPAPGRSRFSRGLFRTVLRAIGVRLVVRGGDRFDAGTDDGGVLVVANHVSWLDILVLGAVQPMRLVAKREVRDWPLLGAVAVKIGTVFVDRASLRSLPDMVAETARALRSGSSVGLFPEGTTWCGEASGPFRRAGFQAALDAGVPVRPVAQRMTLPDGTPTTAGAFIGEDTLLDSLLRVLRLPGLVVELEILPLLVPAEGTSRAELARRAELAVAAATGVSAPPVSARRDSGQLPAVA
jgi:1-acyl-sn-glycerol-3-phosphate acyltransferase